MLSKNDTHASQNGQNRVNKSQMAKRSFLVVFLAMIWLFFIAQSAFAAGYTQNGKTRQTETYKVHLDKLSELYEPRLDWRNPAYDIVFETPTSDWIEKLDFFVKIHAEGQVNRNAPIYVRFNDADPVPVYSRGNSFEAMINLDKSRVKAHRNMISVSFDKAHGCIEKSDGAFSIDMEDSFLVVRTSTPSRSYYLRDAKQILNSPLTTPKTVSLKAYGPDRLKYQALAAQGVALNMPSLPRFSVDGTGEAQVYVGTRQELSSIIAGTEIAKREGKVIGVTKNAPLRLVLTADTHAELDDLVKAFAAKEIPPARRTYAYSGEFSWQRPFSVTNAALQGKKPIYELGTLRFDRGWGNSAQSVKFDVDNPLSAQGTTKLYFQKSPDVSPESVVNVHLNGHSLGTVPLNSKRNAAQFEIPGGILVGTDNVLTINPELTPKADAKNCGKENMGAGFAVDAKSFIKVKSSQGAFSGDLTRLAASGFPFSSDAGGNSAVVFATSSNKEKAAALRAFAQLGKVYGSGWVNAEFYDLSNAPRDLDKHTLFIGPRSKGRAPKGLSAAIDGRPNAPTTVHTAEVSEPAAISLLSARSAVKGGVIAIYEGDNHGQLNGFLTSARGHSFSRAVDQILKPGHWNKLQGSMARWDRNKVEMAKTAFDMDVIAGETNEATTEQKGLVTLPEFSMPTVKMPKIKLPEVKMPTIALPSLAPAQERLQRGTSKSKDFFTMRWNGVRNLSAGLFKPKPTVQPEPPVKTQPILEARPAPVVDIPKPKPTPMNMTIVNTPKTPKTVIVTSPPAPLENATTQVFQTAQVPTQYNPGASLRGLSKASALPAITPKAAPQYQPVSERGVKSETANMTDSVKGSFSNLSTWLGSKLDALTGTGATASENRQANMLLFSAAIILLLLLLALAKPASHRS